MIIGVAVARGCRGGGADARELDLLARGPGALQLQLPGPVSRAAGPGGYVKVQSRASDGSLKYSFAVDPLRLPPYSGELSGSIPLLAAAYINRVARLYPDFAPRGEGKTKINNTLTGYEVLYTTTVQGREMYGRDVLVLPPHARRPGRRGDRDADGEQRQHSDHGADGSRDHGGAAAPAEELQLRLGPIRGELRCRRVGGPAVGRRGAGLDFRRGRRRRRFGGRRGRCFRRRRRGWASWPWWCPRAGWPAAWWSPRREAGWWSSSPR